MFYFFAIWIRNKMGLFMKKKIKCFISHEFQNFTMIHLKLFIQKNEYEIILFFWDNGIGPDGCRALNKSLPSLVQLQTLNLSCNNLCFFFKHFSLCMFYNFAIWIRNKMALFMKKTNKMFYFSRISKFNHDPFEIIYTKK